MLAFLHSATNLKFFLSWQLALEMNHNYPHPATPFLKISAQMKNYRWLSQHCCCSAGAIFQTQTPPKITEHNRPCNDKSSGPGNYWLHSQHRKHWNQWMLWKQDLLVWLQKSEWVTFKRTKVPPFPLICVYPAWVTMQQCLIEHLLLISNKNNAEAKKCKAFCNF